MKNPAIYLLLLIAGFVFLACQQKQVDIPCPQTLSHWDSTDMRHFLEDTLSTCHNLRNLPTPCITLIGVPLKEVDSAYLFGGNDSWGDFDFMCVLYRQSGIYQSKLLRLAKLPQNLFNAPKYSYESIEQEISPAQWERAGQLLRDSGFWCMPYQLQNIGLDGPTFYLASKERPYFNMVRFGNFPPFGPPIPNFLGSVSVASILPVAAYLMEVSGYPSEPYHGVVANVTPDSFELVFSTYLPTMAQQCRLSLNSRVLRDWANAFDCGPLRLPYRLLDSIPYMMVEEELVSGRRRRTPLKRWEK